jgi:hypothetical protein
MTGKVITSTSIIFLVLSWVSGFAQEANETNWKFIFEPYIMFPYMSGETGVRNLPSVDVDANPGDIFDKLQFGAMLYLEAQNDEWAITSDLLYMNLEQGVTSTGIVNSGKAQAKQLGYELAGLYRLAPYLESGIGLRLNSISSELDISRNTIGGPETLTGSLSRTWVDPIVIIRVTALIEEKWEFTFRGDFGGFGLGSTFTWQVQGYVGYHFSNLLQTALGYRIIGINYDKGTGEDRFRYDMNIFGPDIRFRFIL